jgi:hypothetical protein
LDAVDLKLLLLRIDLDLDGRTVLLMQNDDLRDVPLHKVERAEQHVLRLDALGVDVAVANELDDFVDHPELGEIVRGGRLPSRDGAVGRIRRREALPETSAMKLKG